MRASRKKNQYQYAISACLSLCQRNEIKEAILKPGSPSCGATQIYDGSFTGRKKKGHGVTASLLQKNGIKLI